MTMEYEKPSVEVISFAARETLAHEAKDARDSNSPTITPGVTVSEEVGDW